jgi:hypothetical protein
MTSATCSRHGSTRRCDSGAVTPAPNIPLAQLRHARLASQLLVPESQAGSAPGVRTVTQTVEHLLCLQAQDFGQALWAVGRRTPGATRAHVLAALTEGEVVRTSALRGTLHFLPARDLRWILALTSQRSMRAAARRLRETGADDATIARAQQVASAELSGGALTRPEFFAALQAAGITTDGQRGYHLIFALAQAALVCWGPMRGDQQALVLVDEWIPRDGTAAPPESLETSAAVGTLALRYFTGHGPATVRDLAWWSQLPLTAVRAGVAEVRDRLTEYAYADDVYYGAAGAGARQSVGGVDVAGSADAAGEGPAPAKAPLLALPGFDEYLLGYQDRIAVLEPRHIERVVPGKNGLFRPILVADGTVVGVWRRGTGAGPRVSAEPFDSLTGDQEAALAAEDARYRAFLGE